MRLAHVVATGTRDTASPGATGYCPGCHSQVIPKCGPVNVWHWAHKALDCDSWSEPMTRWHADWQELFSPNSREVTIGKHRADIQLPDGLVIEFQHSSLSVDEIRDREEHYGQMVWVFDAVKAVKANRLNLRYRATKAEVWAAATGQTTETRNGYWSFRWKHPRRSILHCHRPVFLDLGDGQLLELKKMYPHAPYGGWGFLRSADDFLDRCEMLTAAV